MNSFTIVKETRHGFETYLLRNEVKDWQVEIIPSLGARVNRFKIPISGKKHAIIKGFQSLSDIENTSISGFYGAHLFPFPNRIKNGNYTYKGKKHQFPINESSRQNALHGFLHNKAFTYTGKSITEANASISFEYESDKKQKGYPFHFVFRVHYILNHQGLHLEVTVVNKDTVAFPVGYGWHPYIDLDLPINELEITIPSKQFLELDTQFIPTGNLVTTNTGSNLIKLGTRNFDSCYVLGSIPQEKETILINRQRSLKIVIYQKSGNQGLNYLQLFTPAQRDCIAIEPMSCPPAIFNSDPDSVLLKQGDKRLWEFGLRIDTLL